MEKQVIDIQKLNNQLTILNSFNRYPNMHYTIILKDGLLWLSYKSKNSDTGNYLELTNETLNEWLQHELKHLTIRFNQ